MTGGILLGDSMSQPRALECARRSAAKSFPVMFRTISTSASIAGFQLSVRRRAHSGWEIIVQPQPEPGQAQFGDEIETTAPGADYGDDLGGVFGPQPCDGVPPLQAKPYRICANCGLVMLRNGWEDAAGEATQLSEINARRCGSDGVSEDRAH